MSVLLRAAQVLGLGPRKSSEEIAGEIAEELAFHLEQRARELEEQGLSPEEALARARELFGDVERTARECARIQLGERIMLVRIQWGLIAILLGLLGFVLWKYAATVANLRHQAMVSDIAIKTMRLAALREQEQAAEPPVLSSMREALRVVEESSRALPAPESLEQRVARWRASLAEKPEDWRHAWKLYQELLALPADEALQALTDLWPGLSVTQKQQALKAFAFEQGHARILAVLHLGATDADLGAQAWAFQYLQVYSFENFAEDYGAYLKWAETWVDRPLSDAIEANAHAFLQELWKLSAEELEERLGGLRIDFRTGAGVGLDLSQVFRQGGALTLVEAWLQSPEIRAEDSEIRDAAFSWARTLASDETWLRAHILPFVNDPHESVAGGALRVLGDPKNPWAVPDLLALLAHRVPELDASAETVGIESDAASALGEIGDPAAIPALIGMIAANPCYDTIYGIGYFGLGKLTGVSYDESHDGDWWIAWWELNKGRFPPEVSVLPIRTY